MTIVVSTPITHQLPVLFSGLAVARLRGESESGLELAARAEEILDRLPDHGQLDVAGLAATLDAHVAALEVNRGRLDVAAERLAHRSAGRPAPAAARRASVLADCAGQLALVEAFRGNLELAVRQACAVQENAAGVTASWTEHAELAAVWVHLERGDDDLAARLLRRTAPDAYGPREPWLRAVRLLAEARLLMSDGLPESALHLLCGSAALGLVAEGGWLEGLVTVATAEAHLAAGEPKRALSVLALVPHHVSAEWGVWSATARRDIGDLRGAREDLVAVSPALPSASLGTRVRIDVLEAQLAQVCGESERARCLVDRALRSAAAEGLRRPLVNDKVWLRTYLERDGSLRGHRGFVASLPGSGGAPTPAVAGASGTLAAPVEALTQREIEVLELLAEMYATDEIALELFLSVNTVKTHIKGVFRKLDVNRRSAAVRRGRELGLC